ncbi:carbohydrate kinase family protein [Sediminibacterium soli]|uniref:carbohydrate kinase family protein n=1 Tax=Sediminibacterium soli TaxID=2698829 RepID=UPI00137A911A|nr:carbohydrate kinase [Sediminibacterium soli]NCI47375.1 carbohydrate kinase [Sediminibacterium soli]
MKILCIGEALIDMICTDKGTRLAEGTHFLSKTGGAPTNVAAAIAALGGDVALSAKVGNDAFGEKLRSAMQDFGVDTQWMLTDENRFTTFAFVSLMEDGERDFVFNRGADAELTVADVDAIDLGNISIIHFGSATAFLPAPLQQAYTHLLQKAKSQGIFISFDPNYRHLLYGNRQPSFIEQSRHFLKTCDFTKLSDEEALLITGKKEITEAADYLLNTIDAVFTITLGKKGALVGINKTLFTVPSVPLQAVDTTGAGDAFVGSVLQQLAGKKSKQLTEENWKAIIANANLVAAETCRYMGAMEAFKMLKR